MGVKTKKKDQIGLFSVVIIVIGGFLVTYWPVAVVLFVIIAIALAIKLSKRKKQEEEEAEKAARVLYEKREMEKRLLSVQNAITSIRSDTLAGSYSQIEQRFQAYVNRHTEALNAAAKQMDTTNNPKVFFEANEKYMSEIEALCKTETQDVFPLNPSPSDIKEKHISDYPQNINEMLERMWNSYEAQAAVLKTDRGKRNRIKSFFDVLSLYAEHFSPDNLNFIEKKRVEAYSKYGLEESE